MSDFELINKAAHRIYPTHLNESQPSGLSWSTVLPHVAKYDIGQKSEGHTQKDERGVHTLTHRLKGGGVLEFTMSQNGKHHIAVAKYQNKGKVYSAIHSHEDPKEAMGTAYMAIKRRMVTEEADPVLIEKIVKRIEKKTGKISNKKEKIDVDPTDPENVVKEGNSTYDNQAGWHPTLLFHDKKLPEIGGNLTAKQHLELHHLHSHESMHAISALQGTNDAGKKQHFQELASFHDALAKKHAHTYNEMSKHFYKELRNHPDPNIRAKMAKWQGDGTSLDEAAIGSSVGFNSEAGHITGKVIAKHTRDFELSGKDGTKYTHHASPDKPVYAIKTKTGHIAYHKAGTIHEEELNELSPKLMGRYIQSAMHDRAWHAHEIGYVNGIAVNTPKGTTATERAEREEHDKKSMKRQNGIYKALNKVAPEAMKESEESSNARKMLADLDYHHGREVHHRQAAELAHRAATKYPMGSENYKLYKDTALGNEAIANHHRKAIEDLHKRFSRVNEEEQLNELSPRVLGNYIHLASIEGRAENYIAGSHHAIGRMAGTTGKPDEHYMKQGDEHEKKSSKRHQGIVRATDKLVAKALKEDKLTENSYHDAVKTTDEHHLSLIRYRMAHPFKERTPEQHAKIKEMENRLDSLKDAEHAEYMKHGGKEVAKQLLGPNLHEAVEDHFKKIPEGLEWELYHSGGANGRTRGYRSKDGEWEVESHHMTNYHVKNRLRDPNKTKHEFYAVVRRKGDSIPHIKSFGSVRGEDASKVNEKAEKMHASLLKKIPNADVYHTNF